MEIKSDPQKREDNQNECLVLISANEASSIDEAINYYLQTHKNDPNELTTRRIKELEEPIHKLVITLKPS